MGHTGTLVDGHGRQQKDWGFILLFSNRKGGPRPAFNRLARLACWLVHHG